MSIPSVGFLIVTGLGCMAALASARAAMPRPYVASKAAASLGFIGTALVSGATGATWSSLALGALILSAAGDASLAVQGRTGFLTGLACFAAAHSVYAAAFSLYGTRGVVLGVTAAAAALLASIVWLSFRNRIPASMRAPVGAYLAIVATMLATGTAAGISHRAVPLFSGVLLVAGSDIAVANERFGKSRFANKLLGLPTYYAGQSLIALSLTGA